ncbi:MarR family winged helix-turn-helix transcriptional regulator [Bacillus sp. KH172YL63]|uniref:MarR family winged helix-turn-helix transcriptional regulator n=1 Tax=Bacillus sp. KH172YL63 TaxID=2709784 RepID=UPI0013E4287C|nr:MarR family transcriptional regulator [Bacillus sp. KH172YL63]BCB04394.1 putative HTH-type transcriptional regulator YpoP [Bacillus sp. KH172YL63]
MGKELFELEGLFRSVFRMMKADIRNIFGEFISNGEFRVLQLIGENGALKSSEISKRMEVSASHITSITDALAEKDYITRQRSNEDRRVVELALTSEGREVLAQCEEKKSQYFQQLFQTFDKEEINDFIKLFEKLLSSSTRQ